MSAKQAPMKDEMANLTLYGPSMPGSKLGVNVPYFFDELYALRIGKDDQGNEFRYLTRRSSVKPGRSWWATPGCCKRCR